MKCSLRHSTQSCWRWESGTEAWRVLSTGIQMKSTTTRETFGVQPRQRLRQAEHSRALQRLRRTAAAFARAATRVARQAKPARSVKQRVRATTRERTTAMQSDRRGNPCSAAATSPSPSRSGHHRRQQSRQAPALAKPVRTAAVALATVAAFAVAAVAAVAAAAAAVAVTAQMHRLKPRPCDLPRKGTATVAAPLAVSRLCCLWPSQFLKRPADSARHSQMNTTSCKALINAPCARQEGRSRIARSSCCQDSA